MPGNGWNWMMILTAYLPAGRTQLYYLIYERDRRSHNLEHAQSGTFLKSWRCEFPWIVIPSLCECLKLQIDQILRNDYVLISILKDRLGVAA